MVDNLENRLIERSGKGDAEAFKELIELYRRRLYSYLIKLSGNRMTADDIFQETLIKVWKNIKRYDERQKFGSWLFSIAHNCSIDYLRKKKLSEATFTELKEESALSNEAHELFTTKEFRERLDMELSRLPFKQRQVFFLRQFGELSFKEIADITKEPINTVLSHMHYAVTKLRTALRNDYAEDK